MDYIERKIERKFLHISGLNKATLVTGARQVGKTTLLKRLASPQNRLYVSLDVDANRKLAKRDPALFFQMFKPPVLIDEVQFAPELFPQIKIICDNSDDDNLFWMTGSQSYKLTNNVQESLAGRVALLNMYSLSNEEKLGIDWGNDFDFSLEGLKARAKTVPKVNIVDVYKEIWRGGMPKALNFDAEARENYFESYIGTFLMRDAAEFGGITDTIRFATFLRVCAALVGAQVNYVTIAESADITRATASEWLKLLEGLGIIYLLRPYSNNALSRLAKTPKMYFCDTGLAAYLTMYLTPELLMAGAASGAFFENYVVMEFVKSCSYAKSKANLTYFRDNNKKEVDIFIEDASGIHPVEIKKSANPDVREIKKFKVLDTINVKRTNGGIVCMMEQVLPIDRENCFIPCNLI